MGKISKFVCCVWFFLFKESEMVEFTMKLIFNIMIMLSSFEFNYLKTCKDCKLDVCLFLK